MSATLRRMKFTEQSPQIEIVDNRLKLESGVKARAYWLNNGICERSHSPSALTHRRIHLVSILHVGRA